MPTYKLTYFDIRARAEVARLVFKAAGVEFEDERLQDEVWPTRKPGLMGSNTLEALRIDEVMEMFAEMLNRELMKIHKEKDEDKKKYLRKTFTKEPLQKYLNFVEMRLKENNNESGFLVGTKLSLGDLVIYDFLTLLITFEIDPFKDRDLLKEHFDRIEAVPNIARWIKERPKSDY